MARQTTPMDTSRLVDLDILLGNRGAQSERAVRLKELTSFADQAVAFALNKPRKGNHFSASLVSDTTLPTAAAWVNGPSIELARGAWNVQATLLVKTGADGIVAARVFNGDDPVFSTQLSHPATTDYYSTLTISGVVILASAKTVTLQAASSITSASIAMISKTTIGGAIDATRISAVQIGA